MISFDFQPNQDELESVVDSLRKKLDENRKMARAEVSANASAIHTPNPSSPTSRTCSPNHNFSGSNTATAENGSKSSQQYHDDSRSRRKKHTQK